MGLCVIRIMIFHFDTSDILLFWGFGESKMLIKLDEVISLCEIYPWNETKQNKAQKEYILVKKENWEN